ncbi:shikimate kinase [Thiohalophilus thiocyanatoxydans]|uniref:Shikimate kinase n=2 Tax=Thiohalophilus thiocyanatoxydans TaxID=381308 RepID=A0A4R8IWS4_9GAMM|nr:shikimate kinase [Thiohalophilus thiocyanatoxydans]
MGAGKTTIGRQLAQVLDKEFIDSDHEIEARTGVNIPLIFELEGEAGFREREAAMLDELTGRENVVLATGGGAVLREENRRHLKQRGTVVYLQTDVTQLLERTRKDKNRPLLQTDDPQARLTRLLQEREPLYLELADLVVNTGQGNIRGVVDTILEKLA